MESLYQADNIQILFDPQSKTLHCHWRGGLSTEQIQHAGKRIVQLVEERKITKILNDNTGITHPWLHTTHWTLNVWFPEILGLGVRAFAWVLPVNILPAAATLRAIPRSKHVKIFSNLKTAQEWLQFHH